MCENDTLAMGVIETARHEFGLRVPQDLAIVGYDGDELAASPSFNLTSYRQPLPEMEFWFPSERLNTTALDRLCVQRLLGGVARPALPERELHGMLKGFADLVFEHAGRYWVLDYKSNALGGNDAAYHTPALVAAMADHRYDIQGAIYMLALHRLLQSRLGQHYDPARQLGGAVFMFLRGIANEQTRGCYLIPPDPELLDSLDQLLQAPAVAQDEEHHA